MIEKIRQIICPNCLKPFMGDVEIKYTLPTKEVLEHWMKLQIKDLVPHPPVFFYYTDVEIDVPSEKTVMEIVSQSPQYHFDYVKEKYDCDDFAQLFTGYLNMRKETARLSFGLAMSSIHAFNYVMYVDEDDKAQLRFYEPQSPDRMITMEEAYNTKSPMYKATKFTWA